MNRNQTTFRGTLPAIGTFVLLTAVFAAVLWQEAANASDAVTGPTPTPAASLSPIPTPSPTCVGITFQWSHYMNPEPIAPADRGSNDPGSLPGLPANYPSIINIAGVDVPETCVIGGIAIDFGLNSERPDDLDILVVDPHGRKSLIISDAGGDSPITGTGYLFRMFNSMFPDSWAPPAGYYSAADYAGLAEPEPEGVDNFPNAGGLAPYPADFNNLNPGGWINTGDWKLYVVDDETGNLSSLPRGWRISVYKSCAAGGGCASPFPTPPTPTPFILSEGFGTVTGGVPAAGWGAKNNSLPIGSQPTWFQGDAAVFPAFGGVPSSYIAGNFNLVGGRNTISNWLITPEIPLANGGMMNFWTRSVGSPYPDRMQVRMSTAGASTNVGDTNASVGDFTNLLMDINPTLWPAWYPTVWTEQRIVLNGLPVPTTGRLAFRYFVTNSGPFGSNGDYVGIDSFQYRLDTCPACATPTPPPSPTPPPTPTPSPTVTPCACASPTPGPSFDLQIGQVGGPDPGLVGKLVTYTVLVRMVPTGGNFGFASPVVRFGLPAGMPATVVRASGTKGFSPAVDPTGVTFSGGSLSHLGMATDTATLIIEVEPNAVGTLISNGSKVIVDPDNLVAESNETNNTAQTVTTSVRRALFDYDGDGRTDHSVFRPPNGAWYLEKSTARFEGRQFGVADDKLAPADYDGDGKADIAVYRSSAGQWFVFNSATNTVSYPLFGVAEDLPAPGDYDGDGKADLTVFRPSQGTWYRTNSSNGTTFGMQFGATGDVPTVGDFDGDGKNDLGIFRPSVGDWYNIRSSNGSVFGERFGQIGDKIAPADYDGDGKTDIAIYRPSTGLWVVRNSATATYSYYVFGAPSDIPVSGDYDGDGKADIGVWRPSDGTWYIQRSSNSQFIVFPWGQNGDKPTPSAYGN